MRIWKIIVFIILTFTALSKFIGLMHPARLLFEQDSVFSIPIFYVVAGACFIEFALCVCILSIFDDWKIILSVFVFAVAVLTYRAILNLQGAAHCPCLGSITQWWPFLGRHENSVLTAVAVWLLLTSAFHLAYRKNHP